MELFLDGVHHYGTAQLSKKWTTVSVGSGGAPVAWTVAAEGRTANCIKMTWTGTASNAVPGYIDVAPLMTNYGPWSPTDSGVCGFAVKVSDLSRVDVAPINNVRYFFAVLEGAGPVVFAKLNTNGTFSVYRYSEAPFDTPYLGASTQGLRSDTWAYVEFKWTIAGDPDGQFQIYLNSTKIYDLQTYTTVTNKTTTAQSFSLPYSGVWTVARMFECRFTNTATIRMCDFYLADQETHSTDYVISDVQGDMTIGAIYPEGVGTYAEWTPLTGANWFEVSEHPPDDDVSYVHTGQGPKRDRHVMQDVPAGAVILGYQSLIYAKKETVGAAIIDPVLRIGGVDYAFDGQAATSPDEYYYIIQPHDNNPADGSQATEGVINAMEAGYDKE